MATPTYATVISQINTYIVANANNEITANVLNPILKVITDFANNTIGELTDLTTTDTDTIVGAINSLKIAFENLQNNGIQLSTGYADPNVTPPASYGYGDFYMELDIIGDVPIQLWQWNGTEWTTYTSVYTKAEIDYLLSNYYTKSELLTQIGLLSSGENELIEKGFDHVINFDWFVFAQVYRFNGVITENLVTDTITLDAAPTTTDFKRFDVIVFNDNFTFSVVKGAEGLNPAIPKIDIKTQIQLTVILVEANTTEPSYVTKQLMYDEGVGLPTEFAVTKIGATITIDSTEQAYSGTKSIKVANPINSDVLFLDKNATFNSLDVDTVVFKVKNIIAGNWRFHLYSYNSIDSFYQGTATIKNGSYGYNSNNITDWQTIIVPISKILGTGEIHNTGFAMTFFNSSLGTFFFDEFALNGNFTQAPIVSGEAIWGKITGTLSDQTDLQNALDAKLDDTDALTAVTPTNKLITEDDIAGLGGGDMLKSTYDPTNVNGDAFDMDNMVEGATTKILTDTERTILSNTSGVNSGDQDLSGKADLVGGLVPSSQLPSFVDDIIEGYLDSGIFYEEVGHTTPITGEVGKIYLDLTSGQSSKQYRWSGSAYIQITNGLIASTADVPENASFLYFTVARVLATVLTGISFATGTAVVATDTVLQAFGKLQKQITDLITLTFIDASAFSGNLTPTDNTVQKVADKVDALVLGGEATAPSVSATYTNIAAMLAAQGDQILNAFYKVDDASADPTITSGKAVYQYLGTTLGTLADYDLIWKLDSGVVSGSTLPTTGLDQGLFFRVDKVNRTILMQYDGLIWNPIRSFGEMTIWADAVGTDNVNYGDGAGVNAYKTIGFAVSQIPPQFYGDVYVNLNGTFNESVSIKGKTALGDYSIYFIGSYTTVSDTSTSASTATKNLVITNTAASYAVNSLIDKFIHITSGVGIGNLYAIVSNTATAITCQSTGVLGGNINKWKHDANNYNVIPTGVFNYEIITLTNQINGSISTGVNQTLLHKFLYFNISSDFVIEGMQYFNACRVYVNNVGISRILVQASSLTVEFNSCKLEGVATWVVFNAGGKVYYLCSIIKSLTTQSGYFAVGGFNLFRGNYFDSCKVTCQTLAVISGGYSNDTFNSFYTVNINFLSVGQNITATYNTGTLTKDASSIW